MNQIIVNCSDESIRLGQRFLSQAILDDNLFDKEDIRKDVRLETIVNELDMEMVAEWDAKATMTRDIGHPIVHDLPIVHLPDVRQDGSLPSQLPVHPYALGLQVDSLIRVVGCAVPRSHRPLGAAVTSWSVGQC